MEGAEEEYEQYRLVNLACCLVVGDVAIPFQRIRLDRMFLMGRESP